MQDYIATYGNKIYMPNMMGYIWMRYMSLCMQTHKLGRQYLMISSF